MPAKKDKTLERVLAANGIVPPAGPGASPKTGRIRAPAASTGAPLTQPSQSSLSGTAPVAAPAGTATDAAANSARSSKSTTVASRLPESSGARLSDAQAAQALAAEARHRAIQARAAAEAEANTVSTTSDGGLTTNDMRTFTDPNYSPLDHEAPESTSDHNDTESDGDGRKAARSRSRGKLNVVKTIKLRNGAIDPTELDKACKAVHRYATHISPDSFTYLADQYKGSSSPATDALSFVRSLSTPKLLDLFESIKDEGVEEDSEPDWDANGSVIDLSDPAFVPRGTDFRSLITTRGADLRPFDEPRSVHHPTPGDVSAFGSTSYTRDPFTGAAIFGQTPLVQPQSVGRYHNQALPARGRGQHSAAFLRRDPAMHAGAGASDASIWPGGKGPQFTRPSSLRTQSQKRVSFADQANLQRPHRDSLRQPFNQLSWETQRQDPVAMDLSEFGASDRCSSCHAPGGIAIKCCSLQCTIQLCQFCRSSQGTIDTFFPNLSKRMSANDSALTCAVCIRSTNSLADASVETYVESITSDQLLAKGDGSLNLRSLALIRGRTFAVIQHPHYPDFCP